MLTDPFCRVLVPLAHEKRHGSEEGESDEKVKKREDVGKGRKNKEVSSSQRKSAWWSSADDEWRGGSI